MTIRDTVLILLGMIVAYALGALLARLGETRRTYRHNKTLTHEWKGEKVTQEQFEDLMESAQDLQNLRRDRDIIRHCQIPHDKVGYCEYVWNQVIDDYWCKTHKSKSGYIVYAGSLLPCLKKENS